MASQSMQPVDPLDAAMAILLKLPNELKDEIAAKVDKPRLIGLSGISKPMRMAVVGYAAVEIQRPPLISPLCSRLDSSLITILNQGILLSLSHQGSPNTSGLPASKSEWSTRLLLMQNRAS